VGWLLGGAADNAQCEVHPQSYAVHLLDAGHFALETHLDAIAGYIRGFRCTLPAKS
jgi:hypothetical protein